MSTSVEKSTNMIEWMSSLSEFSNILDIPLTQLAIPGRSAVSLYNLQSTLYSAVTVCFVKCRPQ